MFLRLSILQQVVGFYLFIGDAFAESDLCGGKPCNRHTVGRTAHVVEADFVAERNRTRFPAMLSADAEFEIGLHASSLRNRDLHQLSHARLINALEGVNGEDFLSDRGLEELVAVVTREPERHLGEVVGSEREKLRFPRDFISGEYPRPGVSGGFFKGEGVVAEIEAYLIAL